jgi:hypothetical protein
MYNKDLTFHVLVSKQPQILSLGDDALCYNPPPTHPLVTLNFAVTILYLSSFLFLSFFLKLAISRDNHLAGLYCIDSAVKPTEAP